MMFFPDLLIESERRSPKVERQWTDSRARLRCSPDLFVAIDRPVGTVFTGFGSRSAVTGEGSGARRRHCRREIAANVRMTRDGGPVSIGSPVRRTVTDAVSVWSGL